MLNVIAFDVANAAKTILGIGGLIFVHELGHFLVGRWCGVKAEAFSIGFGPVVWKWQPGETEYRLSAVPLGGYVKFLGENPDERGEVDPRSFHAATYPRKAAIMLAGVTMNVIAAFVLFVLAFTSGVEVVSPVVGAAHPGLPAWEHGLRPGDRIVEVDGHHMTDFLDISQECGFADEVRLVVERDGVQLPPFQVRPMVGPDGLRRIGIEPDVVSDRTIGVVPGSRAEQEGLRPGDRVVSVDGAPAATAADALRLHTAAAGAETVWTVERNGETVTAKLPVVRVPRIGVSFDSDVLAVRTSGAAAAMGLRTKDVPVSVAGVATPTVRTFLAALATAESGAPVVVRRDGADVRLARPAAALPASEVAAADATKLLLAPAPAGPAAAAGMPEVAEIVSVNGSSAVTPEAVRAATAAAAASEGAVRLAWRTQDGATKEAEIRPAPFVDELQSGLGVVISRPRTEIVRRSDILGAAALGVDRTHRWVIRIFTTLRSLVTGSVSAKKLSGPVALARMTYETADAGFAQLFLFLGMISMNLAVLNVLPVPLLDGGQLALITIERVRGKPLPERVLEIVQWTGLVLLLSFMLYVVVNDIRNL